MEPDPEPMSRDEQILAGLERDIEWLRAETDRCLARAGSEARLRDLQRRAAWVRRAAWMRREVSRWLAAAGLLVFSVAAWGQVPSPVPITVGVASAPAGPPEIVWRAATIAWRAPAYDGPLAYSWTFGNALTNRTGLTTATNVTVEWVLGTNRFSVRAQNATNSALASGWAGLDRRSYATGTFTLLGLRQGPDWRGPMTAVTGALPLTVPMTAPQWWFAPDFRVSNWWAVVPL